jgi:hypothetical protein
MTERVKPIDIYENDGSLLGIGPSQVLAFSDFGTATPAEITYDDSAPNDGSWDAGETATLDGTSATLVATGQAYAGVTVTLLGIELADIQLSTPVNIAVLESGGVQYFRFYNDDGSEADPAALLDSLASDLVTALSGSFGPLLQPLVNAIIADPLTFLEQNALLTMDLTAGGSVAFVPCFASGTMIMTRRGEVAVEDLSVGDHVLTLDHGFRPIRWIGKRHLSARQLSLVPNLRPIRIREGALGDGLPCRDLVVSPQHRCLIRSVIAERVTGAREVLVAAKQLVGLNGIEVIEDDQPVIYFHVMFGAHELIMSNGALTESFYPGPMAMKGICAEDRMEIMTLFPEMYTASVEVVMPPARMLVKGSTARVIAARSAKNTKPLIETRTYAANRASREGPVRLSKGEGTAVLQN